MNAKECELTLNIRTVSLASYIDPTHARPQPERPTAIAFPQETDLQSRLENDCKDNANRPIFSRDYALLRRPSDLSPSHLYNLNIAVAPHSRIEDLIQRDSQGRSYLPSLEDNAVAQTCVLADATTRNQTAFQYRLAELKYDNDTCYRVVCRAPLPEGREKIRLANMRNFFTALEGMSEHWETNGEYYFIEGPGGEIEDNGSLNGHSLMAADAASTENAIIESATQSIELAEPSSSDDAVPPQDSLSSSSASSSISSRSSLSSDSDDEMPMPLYRGRRISCGSKMPWLYRSETIKGFLEAAAFNFGCKVSQPRQQPTLQWGDVRLPLRHQTFIVHHVPKDRQQARVGILEGPLMTCYVRAEFEAFGEGSDTQRQEKARADLLKELGSLLYVAQERRREGRKERLWVKKPPKNGHWFSEMASDGLEPQQDVAAGVESVVDATCDAKADGRKAKKSKTKYSVWKEMNPQKPSWDPKMKYAAMGKDKDSEWDEVYLLSSMHHHVSILRLRVHGAYIDYMTDGTMPEVSTTDPDWVKPEMRRSPWFDLFDIQQRVDVFRCIWGVFCYLTRDVAASSQR
ncbi:hypothetical protein MBLNU459_g4486t2 [Dothideomycetes sp. NU459]